MKLIKKIKKFFKKRKERNNTRQYNDGYDYAAGALLRKEETPLSIDAKIHWAYSNKFDSGIIGAMNKLISLGIIKDNRI